VTILQPPCGLEAAGKNTIFVHQASVYPINALAVAGAFWFRPKKGPRLCRGPAMEYKLLQAATGGGGAYPCCYVKLG
jgi:hypothetical protein